MCIVFHRHFQMIQSVNSSLSILIYQLNRIEKWGANVNIWTMWTNVYLFISFPFSLMTSAMQTWIMVGFRIRFFRFLNMQIWRCMNGLLMRVISCQKRVLGSKFLIPNANIIRENTKKWVVDDSSGLLKRFLSFIVFARQFVFFFLWNMQHFLAFFTPPPRLNKGAAVWSSIRNFIFHSANFSGCKSQKGAKKYPWADYDRTQLRF